MPIPRLSLAALAAVLVLVPTLRSSLARGGGAGCARASSTAVDEPFHEVFFATLEGLYRDGVSNEVADALLVKNDAGGPALFVPGCEICLPVLNALRTYRARVGIEGFKAPFDTFGDGLAEADVAACTSPDLKTRFDALGRLVERWVATRVEFRRFTPEEREAFEHELELRRKKGMAGLGPQTVGGVDATFRACASCDAANAACGR